MTSDGTAARGSCLCGKVEFEFEFPSIWCAHCYCGMCRKAHGAGFVTWIGVDEKRFRVLRGAPELVTYASSPGASRQFCGSCGASMFFRSARWPGEVHVAMACLDTPADRAPEGSAYAEDKVAWVTLAPEGTDARP